MSEAVVIVEQILADEDRIPADMRQRLGRFEDLSTREPVGSSAWMARGWLLHANGEAEFQRGTIPIRICIFQMTDNRSNQEITVLKVEKNKQLYPYYRGQPIDPMEGLEFWVAHPDAKVL